MFHLFWRVSQNWPILSAWQFQNKTSFFSQSSPFFFWCAVLFVKKNCLHLNPFRIPWYKISSSYRSTLTVFGALKLGEIGFGKSSNCSHPNLMKTWFKLPLWKLSHMKAMQLVNESVEEKCQIQSWSRVVHITYYSMTFKNVIEHDCTFIAFKSVILHVFM